MPMLRVLTMLALVSAVIHIRAEYVGPLYVIYMFKPLTMVLILSTAILAAKGTIRSYLKNRILVQDQGGREVRTGGILRYSEDLNQVPNAEIGPKDLFETASIFYACMVITGLLFSMAGDVFLMLPTDHFIAGLISFLIAHLFYITAFSRDVKIRSALPAAIVFVLFGILIYSVLAPYLGKMKLPVIAYILVILVMGWRAWAKYSQTRKRSALFAFFGAVLFIVSDSVLAYNRFREHFEIARALNLSTYFTAQWLIAYSIWKDEEKESDKESVE